jgi:hypothetical protein
VRFDTEHQEDVLRVLQGRKVGKEEIAFAKEMLTNATSVTEFVQGICDDVRNQVFDEARDDSDDDTDAIDFGQIDSWLALLEKIKAALDAPPKPLLPLNQSPQQPDQAAFNVGGPLGDDLGAADEDADLDNGTEAANDKKQQEAVASKTQQHLKTDCLPIMGDCISVLADWASQEDAPVKPYSANLVLADYPYDQKYEQAWMTSVASAAYNILAPGGVLLIFCWAENIGKWQDVLSAKLAVDVFNDEGLKLGHKKNLKSKTAFKVVIWFDCSAGALRL